VLIGRNNSEKRATLEAIYLLFDKVGSDPIYEKRRSNVVKEVHSGSYSSLIYEYSGNAEIEYSINNTKLKLKIDDKGLSKIYIDNVEWNEDATKLCKIFKVEAGFETLNHQIIQIYFNKFQLTQLTKKPFRIVYRNKQLVILIAK